MSSGVYPDAVTPTNWRFALPAVSRTLFSARLIIVSDCDSPKAADDSMATTSSSVRLITTSIRPSWLGTTLAIVPPLKVTLLASVGVEERVTKVIFKDDGTTGSLKNRVSVLFARLRANDCRPGSVVSSTKLRTCCPSTARMGLLLKKSRSVVKNCVKNR